MKQIVSLSGGKDSTAMLLMMLERGEPVDDIVFFDWGMEFEEVDKHLEKLEQYTGRVITRLYPEKPFEYWMFDHIKTKGKQKNRRGYGWPSPKIRWCTRIKYDALHKHNKGAIDCIGYAYQERFRRPRYLDNQRYPLLEWGVTSIEALKYCYSHGFDWGGLYKLFRRVSCWCCPFAAERECKALVENFPHLFKKLQEWNERCEFPLPSRYPWHKYLTKHSTDNI